MTGFIIVLICIIFSIVWGITAGQKRRKELEQQQERESDDQSAQSL